MWQVENSAFGCQSEMQKTHHIDYGIAKGKRFHPYQSIIPLSTESYRLAIPVDCSFGERYAGVEFMLCWKKKLRCLSPRANYTERPPLVGEYSANFLWIEGATWSA
jgi:hypothetical protein